MVIMNGLMVLRGTMQDIGETRAIFPYTYNQKGFSCIFLTDVTPYRLYLTTLGANPLVIELEVNPETYEVRDYFEQYRELVSCLDIQFDANHKFMPGDLLRDLNRHIPQTFTGRPNYTQVLDVVRNKRKIEKANQIYFMGWKRNTDGKRVSPENLEKTRSAFGDEVANLSRVLNVSSKWTDIRNDEQLNRLNEIYGYH